MVKMNFGTRRKPQKTIRYADQEPEVHVYEYEVVNEKTPVHELKSSKVPVKQKAKIFDAIVAEVRPESQPRQSRPITRSPSRNAINRLRYRSTSSHRSPSSTRSQPQSREHSGSRQEFFRFRDSDHGKPLPGMNQFIGTSWPYGLDEIHKHYDAKNRDHSGIPYGRYPSAYSPVTRSSGGWSEHEYTPSPSPDVTRRFRSVSPPINEDSIQKRLAYRQNASLPSTPLPDYMRNLKNIELNETPMMSQIPPRFGTLLIGGRWADVAEGPHIDGPPCKLCHDAITERRCFVLDGDKFHCWHWVCSYCCVMLKSHDFKVALDNHPYCTNCFKRMFP
ncbi:uncharacterized protein LOC141851770 [Brevipalpus obovatus]|uniref:uncharacterized protein LOC141851770 n=1 Tax=Brevipalpus obovatus TaxID=246614 RepID=UPI003D9FA9DB